MTKTQAFAPATIGNIGIGFDIMGLALERPGDEVVAYAGQGKGLRIAAITGDQGKLPYEVEQNTAGMAALRLLEHLGESGRPIDLEIHKKMPLGSGLGSSAASAVAAVVAVNALLQGGLSKQELLHFACLGEEVATGGYVVDNVAPSLLGGIVLIRDAATLDVVALPVPDGLCAAVVHPHVEILTREARAMLRSEVPMRDFVRQSANVAAFVAGLYRGDMALLGRSLRDDIIEPQRAPLIPGFYAVQEAALAAGALGCSISGAGPSIFALFDTKDKAATAGAAMQNALSRENVKSTLYLSDVNRTGAYVL
jgi:homoserine kinase